MTAVGDCPKTSLIRHGRKLFVIALLSALSVFSVRTWALKPTNTLFYNKKNAYLQVVWLHSKTSSFKKPFSIGFIVNKLLFYCTDLIALKPTCLFEFKLMLYYITPVYGWILNYSFQGRTRVYLNLIWFARFSHLYPTYEF